MIVDAHHHVWRQEDLPWLMGPMQPRIFGEYEAIRRDYLMPEFLDDIAGTGVTKSVYVQANWAPDRFEDEVEWVQHVADETGWPHGIVGYADFLADDVRPQLDRLAEYPLMRGVRMQLHWHENEMYRFAGDPDLCTNPKLQENVAHLADYDWSFDLQVFTGQMDGAAELAAACPKVKFILQHAGMPEDQDDVPRRSWYAAIRRLAKKKNVYCKLSGFGTFIHWNNPDRVGLLVQEGVRIFGAERCLYGSNFPIEKLWTTYPQLFAAFEAGAGDLPPDDRRAIFHDTATRVYRL